ncbi:MAG TPA: hypothetical protein VGP07_11120 [Polyangia bacterium]
MPEATALENFGVGAEPVAKRRNPILAVMRFLRFALSWCTLAASVDALHG